MIEGELRYSSTSKYRRPLAYLGLEEQGGNSVTEFQLAEAMKGELPGRGCSWEEK